MCVLGGGGELWGTKIFVAKRQDFTTVVVIHVVEYLFIIILVNRNVHYKIIFTKYTRMP